MSEKRKPTENQIRQALEVLRRDRIALLDMPETPRNHDRAESVQGRIEELEWVLGEITFAEDETIIEEDTPPRLERPCPVHSSPYGDAWCCNG